MRSKKERNRMRMKMFVLLGLLFVLSVSTYVSAQTVVVIVNAGNRITDLSNADLKTMFKAEKADWVTARRFFLTGLEGPVAEKFAKMALGLSAKKMNKMWLTKVFQGVIESPQVLANGAAVKQHVANMPGGIGFIDATEVDASVKILTIDGKKYDGAGYLLK